MNTSKPGNAEATNFHSKLSNRDWLEIEQIGNYDKHCITPPDKKTHWEYTPSGRMCACVKDISTNVIRGESTRKEFVFIFVDLENKVCFEMKVTFEPRISHREQNALKVDSFYFSSEDVLVVVSAFDRIVNQLVYKIDYVNQNLALTDIITHKFMNRILHSYTMVGRGFSYQPTKLVFIDGKDYVLLISDIELFNRSNVRGSDIFLVLYAVPKYPTIEGVLEKEYCFDLAKPHNISNEKIKKSMGRKGEQFNRFMFLTRTDSCLLRGTKLYFTLELTGYDDSLNNFVSGYDEAGVLIGVYWAVDVKKLEDITNLPLEAKEQLDELLNKQVIGCQFVQDDVLYVAEEIYSSLSHNNVGHFICLKKSKKYGDGSSVALFYPSNRSNDSQPIVLDCKVPDLNDRFTLHPHGALLNFTFEKEAHIQLKVMKCLKLNLKSLALNRALFHKNTPIRYHPAYRLCFNREKPIEYSNTIIKKLLKRKHQEC